MLDETQRLRDSGELCRLLDHYAELARDDREAWQDRVQSFEGMSGKELSRLYGELLAHGWLEQNTGVTPVLGVGRLAACYRITAAGVRAVKQTRGAEQAACRSLFL